MSVQFLVKSLLLFSKVPDFEFIDFKQAIMCLSKSCEDSLIQFSRYYT